jgi:hypothetical protein
VAADSPRLQRPDRLARIGAVAWKAVSAKAGKIADSRAADHWVVPIWALVGPQFCHEGQNRHTVDFVAGEGWLLAITVA